MRLTNEWLSVAALSLLIFNTRRETVSGSYSRNSLCPTVFLWWTMACYFSSQCYPWPRLCPSFGPLASVTLCLMSARYSVNIKSSPGRGAWFGSTRSGGEEGSMKSTPGWKQRSCCGAIGVAWPCTDCQPAGGFISSFLRLRCLSAFWAPFETLCVHWRPWSSETRGWSGSSKYMLRG